MLIFIPTLGRSERQITYSYLPDKWKDKTKFVIPWEENSFADLPTVKTPPEVKGIAATRQHIMELPQARNNKVFMMDDDLHFHHRIEKKLVKSTEEEVGQALDMMDNWLDEVPCVGFTSRFGNNWITEDYVECHRPCMAYGLDEHTLRTNNIKFNDLDVCEDYHVFLSVLKLGMKNRMTAKYTVSSPSVNKNGGCAEYRTKDMVESSMKKFIELHSPYAKYRETESDTQGFEIGKELRISWRKCYEESKALRNLK